MKWNEGKASIILEKEVEEMEKGKRRRMQRMLLFGRLKNGSREVEHAFGKLSSYTGIQEAEGTKKGVGGGEL